jgi:hypothetical protein
VSVRARHDERLGMLFFHEAPDRRPVLRAGGSRAIELPPGTKLERERGSAARARPKLDSMAEATTVLVDLQGPRVPVGNVEGRPAARKGIPRRGLSLRVTAQRGWVGGSCHNEEAAGWTACYATLVSRKARAVMRDGDRLVERNSGIQQRLRNVVSSVPSSLNSLARRTRTRRWQDPLCGWF